jgi:peptidoglycan/xylan/chitin deacetylase (PgdA/CDA1 family)
MIKKLSMLLLAIALVVVPVSNLYTGIQAQQTNPNLIANYSGELAIKDTWQKVTWGNNISNLNLQTTGVKDGNYFFRVRTSSYQTGDSRWQFKPVVITPSANYDLSFSYKSSTRGNVTVNWQDNLGNQNWDYITTLNSNKIWTSYNTTYKTNPKAVSMTYFVNINSVGSFDTDSYSLKLSPVTNPGPVVVTDPTKFARGLVSVEFDDGWVSAYNNALPIVDSLGIKTTQYIVTDFTTPEYLSEYLSPAQIKDWRARGHFIGSHALSHPDLTTFDPAAVDLQLKNSKIYLSNLLGEQILGFVTPYCRSNAVVAEIAAKYYRYSRDCDEVIAEDSYLNAKNTITPYHLTSKIVEFGTTDVQIKQWMTLAQAQNKWLILVYHRIDNSGGTWSMPTAEFQKHMTAVKNHGIKILPTMQAFDEVMSQVGK